ncbi:hypothetical protein M3Y95_01243600 [Aphelenchoides besseyi]|nr:hypothetical protein M3Y95_01243600 [Aphelenchoides besseyi]
MFGFARSITWLLVVALLAVNFDGSFGAYEVKQKGDFVLKFGQPPINFDVNPGTGDPANKNAKLTVGGCTLDMSFTKNGNDIATKFNQQKELKKDFKLGFQNDKVEVSQEGGAPVKLLDCKLEATERDGKKFVKGLFDGSWPDGFNAKAGNADKVDAIPEPTTQPPPTTKAPTTQPPTTQPPATEPPTEPSTVAVTDVGNSTGNSTGPNNGAEVGRSVGIGLMVVFGLLAVRVF